jgi:hypothetical protein
MLLEGWQVKLLSHGCYGSRSIVRASFTKPWQYKYAENAGTKKTPLPSLALNRNHKCNIWSSREIVQ